MCGHDHLLAHLDREALLIAGCGADLFCARGQNEIGQRRADDGRSDHRIFRSQMVRQLTFL